MKISLAIGFALVALVVPIVAQGASATKQDVAVTGWIEGPGGGQTADVFGEASLVRTDDGVSMNFQTTGLPAGQPVTIWWIILSGGAPVSAQFAAGHVVGNNGVASFAGQLAEGDTSGCFHPDFPCQGLTDARGQTIILLARVHGPKDPGRIPIQIHTGETNFGGPGFEDDLCNPTFCQIQAAVFAGS
jgi:hypothetical protein